MSRGVARVGTTQVTFSAGQPCRPPRDPPPLWVACVPSYNRPTLIADFAERLATIVSGGARGVDQSVMLGALESRGTAVGVLADSLLRSATSAKYRKYLVSNDLALVTPFNPEARFHFHVGSAMSRNKYIYMLGRRRGGRVQHAGTRRHLERSRGEPEGRLGAAVGQE